MNNTNNNKMISNTSNLKFLGIIIEDTLSSKSHIDMIAPELSQACFIARVIKPFLFQFQFYLASIIATGVTLRQVKLHI
jgi:hypothetical protein